MNITCQRSLENFARLWICGLPRLTNGYQVTLSMSAVSGSPAIHLYNAVETDGGIGYLTDTNIAGRQLLAQAYGDSPYSVAFAGPSVAIADITASSPFTFPASYFTNSGNKYFLFEGAGAGEGRLTLTLTDNHSNVLAQTGVWLDLHDIKDFYERAVITNNMSGSISHWTSGLEVVQPATSSALGDDTNLIVLVHGINVDKWHWLDQSDTVLKRLYWANYHGKFATVDWPCYFLTPPSVWDVSIFNRSELNAYKASAAIKSYLTQLRSRLPNYRLNILAHSQGNAVVSEAIKQGAPFDSYILTQGALPANCYDVNAATNSTIASYDTGPNITPQWQPLGYQGVYMNLAGRIVNFYNPFDPVLNIWITDQKLFKPSQFYSYDGTNCWYLYDSDYGLYRQVTDSEESRAMISRSRTLPIGQASANEAIQSDINLNAQFGFKDSSYDEHSAQWTRPIQTSLPYYVQVLKSLNP